jgi:Flp pilus assembly protein TadG
MSLVRSLPRGARAIVSRLASAEGGQSLVELALTLPILIFILLGGADLARGFAQQLAVQNGARAGAEAAAIDYTPSVSEAIARARDEMSRTPGMDGSQPTVGVGFAQTNGSACVDPPTVAAPCYATVRVQYTFRTIIPWPLIPNVANFDRSTTMRMIKAQ